VATEKVRVLPVSWYEYQAPHQLFVVLPSSRLSNRVRKGVGVGVPVRVKVAVATGVPPVPTNEMTLWEGRV
jgi:hypothetical protein